MQRRTWLIFGIFLICGGSVQANEIRWVTFETIPQGAAVFLVVSAPNEDGKYLGAAGLPIAIDLSVLQNPSGHPVSSVVFRFRHPHCRPAEIMVPRQKIPERGTLPPIILETDHFGWTTVFFLRDHPVVLAGTALALLLGVPLGVVRQRRLQARLERSQRILAREAGADPSDPLLQTRLDAYRLLERIGTGGMATVYLGVPDETLDASQAVAVKVMNREVSQDDAFSRRFRREIAISSRLSHPAIVRVLGSGEQHGLLYLVMERVQGETLRRKMRPDGLPLQEALAYLRPVLQGLAYAHHQGVIHRDVKPENVMVTAGGQVRLMDFGLARAQESSRVTLSGSALGTPGYMAPEQIGGQTLEPRSDQYSVGVLAYELLCGRPPFSGGDGIALLFQHFNDEIPPLRTCREDLPVEVEAVVMRMLSKDPEQRYASLDEVLQALDF